MRDAEGIRIAIGGIYMFYDSELEKLKDKQSVHLDKTQYPRLGKIKMESFAFNNINTTLVKEEKVIILPNNISSRIDDQENIVVLKDGNIIYTNLNDNFAGIKVSSYFDALEQNDQEVLNIIQEHLATFDEDKLVTLNKMHLNSFLYINVPKNRVIKDALKVYVISSRDLAHETFINLEANSELTLVESLESLGPVNFNYISETIVNDNAKLNYIGIDRLSDETTSYIGRYGYVKDDASLVYALGQLNDGNTFAKNHIKLIGRNSYAESRNVLFTDKDNTHVVLVNMEHLAPYSVGFINNHGIVKDKGYLFVDGIGKIHQGMNGSNSQQHTSIINLSDNAKVNANPFLLIDEYDVNAGHGAAIGKVNEDQLYYLMSRGLSKRDAEKLIIYGFLTPVLELLTSENIRASFIKTIEKKLSVS
ncbi:MAG: SufD family Fe-S cluster assembly protein [Bacilli bacterium]|nr:SufD family Fe-S cluster assembly protein [Bacilli bacterium]